MKFRLTVKGKIEGLASKVPIYLRHIETYAAGVDEIRRLTSIYRKKKFNLKNLKTIVDLMKPYNRLDSP